METVKVENVQKSYKNGNDRKIILNKINMTVKKGSIYGIIGASGCGKTTLLSCILGIHKIDSGKISVFGSDMMMNNDEAINAKKIGFMPQETALVDDLTIKETIFYFGKIYQMNKSEISERFKMLMNLLELPSGNVYVGKCSGGQQRRISLAIALIHNPELLILDEPTVGVDPVLRIKIWNFMAHLTRNQQTTIIITTHYIEEARHSDCCGLMRNGNLLAEDAPHTIIQQYQCENLEAAFLHLCTKQEQRNEDQHVMIQNSSKKIKPTTNTMTQALLNGNSDSSFDIHDRRIFKINTIKAIMHKTLIQLLRQPAGIYVAMIIPAMSALFFFWAIGGRPQGLTIGIINKEVSNHQICSNTSLITTFTSEFNCHLNFISCRFLSEITPDIAEKKFYDDYDDAMRDAKKGNLIAILDISVNITKELQRIFNRDDDGDDVNDEIRLSSREIRVHLDQSNQQISFFIQRKLFDVYKKFTTKLMTDCKVAKKFMASPVNLLDPIYGNFDADFKESMATPLLTTLIFFCASGLALTIFNDRKEGFWNRTLVAGVSVTEILISHIMILSFCLFIIIAELMTFTVVYLSVSKLINIVIITAQLVLLAYAGLLLGLCISCLCDDFLKLNLILTAIGHVYLPISGMFWPLEGMPKYLLFLSQIMPTTWPAIAIKNVMYREAGMTHPSVIIGFSIVIIWIIVFFICAIIILKHKKFDRK